MVFRQINGGALAGPLLARGVKILSDYEGTVLDRTDYNTLHFANPDGDEPAVGARTPHPPSSHEAIDL